jgi:hypothetical protein
MHTNELSKIIDILIDNLPENLKDSKNPLIIDLILDGGIFNGSYLLGTLFFFKEMEKRNYIKVERISGCSIGSLLGFLYLIDSLDLLDNMYKEIVENFKENCNFKNFKHLKIYLKDKIPIDISSKINKKLFIKYNNIKKGTQKVKSTYKNEDELINSIFCSSFFPCIIDGDFVYKDKYIDGINPYIFKKRPDRKIFFMDLTGLDKVSFMLNIKNENTNFHRILAGLVETYMFYIKKTETSMCSCVNDWNYLHKIYFFNRQIIEKIICLLIYFIHFTKKYMNKYFSNEFIYKIIYDIFIIIIRKYCI